MMILLSTEEKDALSVTYRSSAGRGIDLHKIDTDY
jgi:hypothetical protein